MTHNEIRALVVKYRNDPFRPAPSSRIPGPLTAIETLLAERDAIREAVEQHADCYNTALCDAVRGILNDNGDDTQ